MNKEITPETYETITSLCNIYWKDHGQKVYSKGWALKLAEDNGWTDVDTNWTFFCKDIGYFLEDHCERFDEVIDLENTEIQEVIGHFLSSEVGISSAPSVLTFLD